VAHSLFKQIAQNVHNRSLKWYKYCLNINALLGHIVNKTVTQLDNVC